MRIQVKDFEEGLLKRVSPEDLPKSSLVKSYDVSIYNQLGAIETRRGRERTFDVTFPGTVDLKYTKLSSNNKLFIKADTVLYKGIRPIKQSLSSNRMDFTEFSNWLLMCDGENTLKYRDSMELSWLVSCCFSFEEAGLPSGWTTHQSAIPFRVSHDLRACTYEWERVEIDGGVSLSASGVFYTTNCDLGGSNEAGTAPDANMLLHFDASLSDAIADRTASAVGDAAISSTQRKFGAKSLRLDGDGDYLTVADSGDWALGTGALTIDFWFFIPTASSNVEHCLFSQISAVGGYALWYNDQTSRFHFWCATTTEIMSKSFTYVISKGSWYHVALIRGWGNLIDQWAICVNGSSQAVWTNSIGMPDLEALLRIGSIDAATDGTLQDYSFTPHSLTYVDLEAKTGQTKFGDCSIGEVEDFGEQDWSYVSFPQDSAIKLAAAFTVDVWLRVGSGVDSELGMRFIWSSEGDFTDNPDDWPSTGEQIMVFFGPESSGPNRFVLSSYEMGVGFHFDHDHTFDSEDYSDAWHHLMVCRVGDSFGFYIDGVQKSFYSSDLTWQPDAVEGHRIMAEQGIINTKRDIHYDEYRWHSGNPFAADPNIGLSDTISVPEGRHDVDEQTLVLIRPTTMDSNIFLDEFRWKKGAARWIENFDVPTEADLGGEDSEGAETIAASNSLAGDMAVPLGMDASDTAVSAATGVAGDLTGDYYYKVTFGNEDSFESNPCPISDVVQPDSDKVDLTDIPQSNNPQVIERHIYRTEAGGGTFYYLTTIEDNYTTTYTDNTVDSDLSYVVETNHDAPPALQTIHSHSSRIFGVSSEYPNKLVWCNAWDEMEYFDINNYEPFGSQSEDIKKLSTLSGILIVIQRSKIWLFDTRTYPEYNWVKSETAMIKGVLSAAAAVKIGAVILCLDAEGGYVFDGQKGRDITQSVSAIFDFDGSDNDLMDESRLENLAVGHFKDYLLLSYSTGIAGSLGGINDRTIVYNRRAERVEQIMRMGFSSFSTNLEDKICYAAGYDGYIYKIFSTLQDIGNDITWQIQTKDFSGEIGPELALKEASFFWIDCNPNGNSIVVNTYMDDVAVGGQAITGDSRKVVSFRLSDKQFYRISFNIVGSGNQQIYRIAFEADPIEGQSEIQG